MSFLRTNPADLFSMFFDESNRRDAIDPMTRFGFDHNLVDKDSGFFRQKAAYKPVECSNCGETFQARKDDVVQCPFCGQMRNGPDKNKALAQQQKDEIEKLQNKLDKITDKKSVKKSDDDKLDDDDDGENKDSKNTKSKKDK